MGGEEGEGQDREVECASVKYKLQRRALFCRHCRFGAHLTLGGGREGKRERCCRPSGKYRANSIIMSFECEKLAVDYNSLLANNFSAREVSKFIKPSVENHSWALISLQATNCPN